MTKRAPTTSPPAMQTKAEMEYTQASLGSAQTSSGGMFADRLAVPWAVNDGSADRLPKLTGTKRQQLIMRARTLGDQNKFAILLLDKAADHIVQDGFQLSTKCPSHREYAAEVVKGWNEWTKTASVQGHDWIEHQRLRCLHLLREGDIGVMFSGDEENGGLQLHPAACIKNPKNNKNKAITDGVEVDGALRPLAYYVAVGAPGARDTKRVKADFFHLCAIRKDALDVRGNPVFNGHWSTFDHLDSFNVSVVIQAHLQAKNVYSLETEANGVQSMPGTTPTTAGNDTFKYLPTKDGGVLVPPPGKTVKYLRPEGVALDVDKFTLSQLKLLSPCVGMPVEMLMTSMGNYSSNQSAVQDAYKAFKRFQNILVHCDNRTFDWWFARAIANHVFAPPPADFSYKFILPSFLYINRVESAQADLLELNMGISTLQEVIGRRGKDYETLLEQLQEEVKDRTDYKLPPLPFSTYIQSQQGNGSLPIEDLAKAVLEYQAQRAA